MVEKLGRYTLVRALARGGMAEVFLASQTGPAGFERPCVIKRMLPNLSADASFVKMFLDEAQLAAQLQHPNIAQIQDFGEENGTYFIVMEYVPGTELRTVVRDLAARGRTLPLGTSAAIAAQVARALDYAFSAPGRDGRPLGVIHRDVSPHNILITPDGAAKLIDFGIARIAHRASQTAEGVVKGKLAYMAPEQVNGRTDHRSDVYALGLVLYEMLTGQRALRGEGEVGLLMAVVGGQVAPLRTVRPELPERLTAVVDRALAVSPDARYQAASQLAQELERLVPQLGGADWSYADAKNHTVMVPRPDEARPTVRATPLPDVGPEPTAHTRVERPSRATPEAAVTVPSPAAVVTTVRAPVAPARRSGSAVVLALVVGLLPPLAALAWRMREAPAAAPDAPFFDGTVPVAMVRPAAEPQRAPAPPVAPAAPKPGRVEVSSALAAEVSIDGEAKGAAPVRLELPAGEHTVALSATKEGTRWESRVTVEPERTAKVAWAPKKGSLVVRAFPWAEVWVAGRRVGITPFAPLPLYEGRYTVRLSNKDSGKEQVEEIEITAAQQTNLRADLSK